MTAMSLTAQPSRSVLRSTPLLWAEGKLQREGNALSKLVRHAGTPMRQNKSDTRVIQAGPSV